jgi:hypothetical protein
MILRECEHALLLEPVPEASLERTGGQLDRCGASEGFMLGYFGSLRKALLSSAG